MIQRIQSLYLLLSALAGMVCLCQPLGTFFTAQHERYAELFNLWVRIPATEQHIFSPWALFALLLIVTTLTLIDIFLFTRRALQMRVATLCMVLLVGYYAYLATFAFIYKGEGAFTPSVWAALPFASIVLDYLAFRGILKDEMLVKSLDRLR